jgi:hypothetical protein
LTKNVSAYSPELTLVDFLWGTLKSTVYQHVPAALENMQQHDIYEVSAKNRQVCVLTVTENVLCAQ